MDSKRVFLFLDSEPICGHFSGLDMKRNTSYTELSDSLLDTRIPSFPGSPRSLYESGGSVGSLEFSRDNKAKILRDAVNFLHCDNDYLHFAEMGDDKRLELAIRQGTNVNAMDQLGRTALHFAVQSGNIKAITLLLSLGIHTNKKDNVGMTPLSLCLMRRPSLKVAKLLFDYGAKLMPRTSPVDTGLFLQFVMMCIPTREDAKILRLLIEKGALINDPSAPGGRSALHFAAMSNNCDLIRVLLNLGADLLAVNHRGQTPRDVAVTFHCKAAAVLLGMCMDDMSSD